MKLLFHSLCAKKHEKINKIQSYVILSTVLKICQKK